MLVLARTMLALVAAAVTSLALHWLPTGLLADTLLNFPAGLVVASALAGIGAKLLPGLVVGIAAQRHPLLLGATISGVVATAYLAHVFSISPLGVDSLRAALWFLEYFAFGLAGACAGVLLRRVQLPRNAAA